MLIRFDQLLVKVEAEHRRKACWLLNFAGKILDIAIILNTFGQCGSHGHETAISLRLQLAIHLKVTSYMKTSLNYTVDLSSAIYCIFIGYPR